MPRAAGPQKEPSDQCLRTRKVLSAAAALSAALSLTAIPASATTAPTALAAAEAALTPAQAQVQAAIKDQATLSAAKWDAQMSAALAAEATAEAQLRPFLAPPTYDFGVIHTFTYKAGGELTYKVQLAPINGSTNGDGIGLGGCNAKNIVMNLSGVCYGPFPDLADGTQPGKYLSGVAIHLNTVGNGKVIHLMSPARFTSTPLPS